MLLVVTNGCVANFGAAWDIPTLGGGGNSTLIWNEGREDGLAGINKLITTIPVQLEVMIS